MFEPGPASSFVVAGGLQATATATTRMIGSGRNTEDLVSGSEQKPAWLAYLPETVNAAEAG
jgi:hypothetical protein